MPGSVIAGGDSHTCTYGALGAFGTGLGSTDIASCLALGSFWQAVPETIQVEFTRRPGQLRHRQDVILAVHRGDRRRRRHERGARVRRRRAREALSVDERLAVANMAVEAGSETGIFPADDDVDGVPRGPRTDRPWTAERSDPDATFAAASRRSTCRRSSRSWRCRTFRATSCRSTDAGADDDRPGLHRQLRERDDDRPPPGGRRSCGGRRVHPRLPRDRRPGDAARSTAQALRRGPARPVRRGGRDGLDADLRRVLRRLTWACSPRARRAVTTTNRNFRGRMGSPEAERAPRERVRRRGGGRRRRARPPGA
mgnify:CR=1 FL=1